MRLRIGSLLMAVTVACGFATSVAGAAEVALLFSVYQEEKFSYMPGEYVGQYKRAGARIKEAGFDWDRVDSKAVETGALIERGYKVLVISYISTMSRAEATAISEFVKQGGKLLTVYASCRVEYPDGEPGECLIAEVLGMDAGGGGKGCRYMRAEKPGHPLMRLLPVWLPNAHGYSVRMKPREGTEVVAKWVKSDLATSVFAEDSSGAILVSDSAVYFSGYLWYFPEAKIIVRNALNFLLGREQEAEPVVWESQTEARRVAGGLNLQHAETKTEDVDAIGWRIAEAAHGILQPRCAVVYPADAPDSFYAAKRVARALSCPLVPDVAVHRDGLGAEYDLIVVGHLYKDRCQNFVGNMQRGIGALLSEYGEAAGKGVVRIAPEDEAQQRGRLLLVGGSDLAGLRRADRLVRQGVEFDPGQSEGKVLVWQPTSAFGDLVYPWTRAGEPLTALVLPSAINQRAKTQFVITASMGYRPLELELVLSSLSGAGGTIGADRIKLLATRYVRSNVTKIPEPDPLVPATRISVEPGGHQQMWLIVDCADAEPGEYRGALRITNDSGEEIAKLPVTVDIAAITLAPRNRHGLLTAVWDYGVSSRMCGALSGFGARGIPEADQRTFTRWNEHYEQHFREHWRAYIRDLENHGVNVMFLGTCVALPQYQMGGGQINECVAGQVVGYGKEHGFRLFIFTQILGQSPGSFANTDDITPEGSPIFSPEWDEAYRQLLRAYVSFAERMGLGFEEWAVYAYDEPHTDHARKVTNHVAGLIDQVEPRIQLWSDPACPSGSTREDMVEYWRSMANGIDIWWPGAGYIAKGTAALAYLRGLGEPFGFYRCSAYTIKDRGKWRPDRYYRAFGWEAMDRGASGMGFWTWCAWLGDSWDDKDISVRRGDGAVVYEGPAGPITSIGWEAWSEGVDDYKYLAALEEAITARAAAAGEDDERCAAARRLLSEAIGIAVGNLREADHQRARVRDEIVGLAD